jgi:hypothetical protein
LIDKIKAAGHGKRGVSENVTEEATTVLPTIVADLKNALGS